MPYGDNCSPRRANRSHRQSLVGDRGAEAGTPFEPWGPAWPRALLGGQVNEPSSWRFSSLVHPFDSRTAESDGNNF